MTFNIYNDLIYNFAINLTKLDENEEPLQGVRVKTTTSILTDNVTDKLHQVFEYKSKLTDENGKVKLKIVLPENGEYRYYGKTIEVELNEYYVPDNYKAQTKMKLRVLFDGSGNITDKQLIREPEDTRIDFIGMNNITPDDMEKQSVDVKMLNERITEKPSFDIENVDVDDDTVKLQGTKYQIDVFNEDDYAKNNLVLNETKYSTNTNNEGKTTINFENAHALRTMVYRIKEVQTANSYMTNENMILKITYDEEGKIVKKPEIIEGKTIKNAKNQDVDVLQIVGNPENSTTVQLKIVNEISPKFTINIARQDTENNVLKGKEFKVISEIKNDDGTYTQQEERLSRENTNNKYEVGFKQENKSKTIRYTISEKTGNEYTQRAEVEIKFDIYGDIESGTYNGKYIKDCNIPTGENNFDITIEAEIFRIAMTIEDKENSTYSLEGYTFKITNSKGEESDVNTKTNAIGNIIEIVGECYKGENLTYKFEQVNSPVDYNDIENLDLTIEFNEDGTIKSCTPNNITDKYDLITTDKADNINMEIKLYTTPAKRNSIKVKLVDDADKEILLGNAEYTISEYQTDTSYSLITNEETGEGEVDIGAFKNYKERTVSYIVTQTKANDKYMINDKTIQISVDYDKEGKVTDARVIASDDYVEIDTVASVGTENVVIKTANRRKTVMKLENQSTQSPNDKVANAQFKIIQEEKTDLYSDTKMTDINGEATLYVGPYYISQDITYIITNTVKAKEFKKFEDAKFTLTYDETGKVTNCTIPENIKANLNIDILNNDSGDIKITIKVDPLLTIGVDAINKNNKKLIGGKYDIVQVDNQNKKDTVITKDIGLAHATIGETEQGKTIEYQITERQAPEGYKYKNKDNIIGKLEVQYDTEGRIIQNTPKINQGYEFIKIAQSTDKNSNYDIDIEITYEESEEFKIIIENYNIVSNVDKIQSKFTANLSQEKSVDVTTDANSGIGTLDFGKITKINTKQTLTISQSDIQGNYIAISQIRMDIEFDESGKIKKVEPTSRNGIAEINKVYTIDYTGDYTIKITVKNNPTTVIKITNISDGSNRLPVDSTMILSGGDIKPVTMTTSNGDCETTITPIPKNKSVYYTISQTKVQKGYTKNKDIRLLVTYDNNGFITDAYIVSGSTAYADLSVVQVTYKDEYEIDLEIKNKTIFEIYLETQDSCDSNIKLSGINVRIREETYSNTIVNLTTDLQGIAHTELASTFAGNYLDYEVDVMNNISGYDDKAKDIESIIRVWFDQDANVLNCTSSNPQVEVKYGSGNAIEITVKYTPLLKLNLTRRNTATNESLNGRIMNVTSSAMSTQNVSPIRTTNEKGMTTYNNAGLIKSDGIAVYTITEQERTGYTSIENMGTINVTVYYDGTGKISSINSDDTDHVITSGEGTRILDVEIGSDSGDTISIVNNDYYINTERISSKFEIESSKGESVIVSSTTGTTNVIEKLGRLYPGETIEYTIHQTETQTGYQVIPDTKFTVEYKNDGTIGTITSLDTNVLEIKEINQQATLTQANINIEIHSKPVLMVNLKVFDKQYNSAVDGIGFKIKDETSGYETTIETVTDENGNITIPVDEAYENTHVTYTITNIKTFGGYKTIPTFQVVVQYGPLGTIIENGTYIINTEIASVTQNYSEDLYTKNKQRGIQIKVEIETQLGIGVEKVDVDGNLMEGIEFTISATEVDSGTAKGNTKATNQAGEIIEYFGDLPIDKIIEYKISEVEAPAGYRKIDDIILRVYFDTNGRISSYTTVQSQTNTSIEVATNKLLRMTDSKEIVHIKVKVVNDNRVTFKIVNTENNVNVPIQGSKFQVSIETATEKIIQDQELETDINGEIKLEDIDASGTIKLFFNQLDVPAEYTKEVSNQGYITINKSSDVYKLAFDSSTDNLNYNIDSEKGIVTVYLKNDNNLLMNIFDVDNQTQQSVNGATHTIIAQYGEKNEDKDTITKRENNKITYNSGNKYTSEQGVTNIQLGDTYNFCDKKVVYTIETPDTAEKPSTLRQ